MKNCSSGCIERQKNEQYTEQTGEGHFCVPQNNLSSTCIPIMNFILYCSGDIFDEKVWKEGKRSKYREDLF